MNKKLKLTFAPGCFDNFNGSQEDLDELINHIKEMVSNMTPEDFENHPEVSELDLDAKLFSQEINTRH